MQARTIITLLTLGFSATASANADWYLGINYKDQDLSRSVQDINFDFDFKTLGAVAGYRVHPNLIVEGRVNVGTDGPSINFDDETSEADIAHQIELLAKAPYELAPGVDIFAFAGVSKTKIDSEESWLVGSQRVVDKYSDSDTVITYGIGAQYTYNETWTFGLEYQGYGDFEFSFEDDDTVKFDHDSVNLLVSYQF